MVLVVALVFGTVLTAAIVWIGMLFNEKLVPQAAARIRYSTKGLVDLEILMVSKALQLAVLRDLLTDIASRADYLINVQSELRTYVAQAFVSWAGRVLVTKLQGGPMEGFWSLPAGYVPMTSSTDLLETLQTAAKSHVCGLPQSANSSWTRLRPLSTGNRTIKDMLIRIEGRIIPTDVYIFPFELEAVETETLMQGETKWCTPAELLELPGKVHPLLWQAVEWYLPGSESVANELRRRTEKALSEPSEFWASGRIIARRCLRPRKQKQRYLRVLQEVLLDVMESAQNTEEDALQAARQPSAEFLRKLMVDVASEYQEEVSRGQ